MTRGSGNKQFIPIVFYGSDDIFVNFITLGMLKKLFSSIFRHRFQHIIRQIVCVFISFASMHNIIIFKAKKDRQIKVYLYFF